MSWDCPFWDSDILTWSDLKPNIASGDSVTIMVDEDEYSVCSIICADSMVR